jgi:hypothetical protein
VDAVREAGGPEPHAIDRLIAWAASVSAEYGILRMEPPKASTQELRVMIEDAMREHQELHHDT